jgi:linoleoyl-CoA desaturase
LNQKTLCGMNNSEKILFKRDTDGFTKDLNSAVDKAFSKKDISSAVSFLWVKLFFYLTLFLGAIFILYANPYGSHFSYLALNYIAIGTSGILLAFNSSHDACHQTFSNKKWVNDFIFYCTFNMQGTSARLWRIRHLASHHLFSNVDGCDADVDDNPLLRFSPNHKKKSFMKYQHFYAPILYSLYFIVWIYAKDFVYLNKKNLANLKNQDYPFWYTVELLVWKLIYVSYMIVLPYYLLGFSLSEILWAYLLMIVVGSNIFIYTLVTTHFTMETEFPTANEKGELPYSFAEHQLIVSMDYHPTNPLATFLFGGFNSHAAHHLFPTLPHTIYPKVTPIIVEKSSEYNYKYNALTLLGAISSHFKYLKKLGQ